MFIVSNISSKISTISSTIVDISSNVSKQINQIDFINPNVLIDIYIKFVIVASIFYILYKYYLIDITIDNMYKLLNTKFDIYVPSLKNIIVKNQLIFNNINDFMTNYRNKLATLPSKVDSSINDTNMIIIFSTMVVSLLLIICVIIYLTNGYNNINFKSIVYSIFFNLLFIILSQFILFYVIYTFIDPIKIYKFFYYDYDIKPIDTTTPAPSTLEDAESILKTQLENLKIKKPISKNEQSLIIDSQRIGTIYIFNIIFICIFIIMFVLSLLNYLIVYNNYKISSSIIPFTQFSLIIYIILGCLSLLIFIILLILLLNYF
jgi:hypothetical protein